MEISKKPHIYIWIGGKGGVNKASGPHHSGWPAAGSGVDGAHREGRYT